MITQTRRHSPPPPPATALLFPQQGAMLLRLIISQVCHPLFIWASEALTSTPSTLSSFSPSAYLFIPLPPPPVRSCSLPPSLALLRLEFCGGAAQLHTHLQGKDQTQDGVVRRRGRRTSRRRAGEVGNKEEEMIDERKEKKKMEGKEVEENRKEKIKMIMIKSSKTQNTFCVLCATQTPCTKRSVSTLSCCCSL